MTRPGFTVPSCLRPQTAGFLLFLRAQARCTVAASTATPETRAASGLGAVGELVLFFTGPGPGLNPGQKPGWLVGLGWVGLGWVGLGWVGFGWVGLGWVGLGWLVTSTVSRGRSIFRHQTSNQAFTQPESSSQAYVF